MVTNTATSGNGSQDLMPVREAKEIQILPETPDPPL
jgi:hypothetical protein